jgi:outer membrane lipopolysaccharide assembly protein LptE/RlpB
MKPAALALALVWSAGCGYHVAGHADLMPKNIRTIAIPAFGNVTVRYKLAERLPADITRAFLSRTRYRVVADPSQADAVLTGAVTNVTSYPSVTDPATGRATGLQVIVLLQLTLTDRTTGKVLFARPGMEVRDRAEISVDPKAYFDESEMAMTRLSRNVANAVVSAILENF